MSGPERVSAPDFYAWAFPDFLSNTLRGVLAEYLVALAAGCERTTRTEWDAFDLLTDSGLKIEVKSAAYLQTWTQRQPSPIRFGIAEKRGWNARSNATASAPVRAADIYVFCVFAEQERARADPLDLSQWFFLVCSTERLDAAFGAQKSVSLSALETLGLPRLDFARLHDTIRALSGQPPSGTGRPHPSTS